MYDLYTVFACNLIIDDLKIKLIYLLIVLSTSNWTYSNLKNILFTPGRLGLNK